MSRMESPDDNYERVSARLSGDRLEKFEALVDETDMSKSDIIRRGIDAVAGNIDIGDEDAGKELAKPLDDDLREAYETLLDVSDHPRGPRPISVDEAEDALYSSDCPKSNVRRRYLRPLDADGFIAVKSGRITVRRCTVDELDRLRDRASQELDQLDDADRGDNRLTRDDVEQRDELNDKYQQLLIHQRAGIDPTLDCIGWACEQTVWSDSPTVRADGGSQR